jgi:fucose permease
MPTYPTRHPRLSIALSFYGFMLVGIAGGVGGVLLPSLGAFYHQGDAMLGTLFLVFALSYSISSVCTGPLVARLSLRWLLALGVCVLMIGYLGFIFEVPFVLLYLARLCYGVGIGIIETGFNIYLSSLPRRTTLLNNLHAFYGVGSLIGPVLASGMLALLFSWNQIYIVLVALNVILLVGALLLMSRPRSAMQNDQEQSVGAAGSGEQSAEARKDQGGEKNFLRDALALPILWIVSLFLLIYCGVEICASSWGYNYLIGARALVPFAAGWVISGFGFGLTIGRFIIQPLAEKRGVGLVPMMYALIFCSLVSLLIIWLAPWGALAGVGFCLLGFSLAPVYPVTVALIPRLVPRRLEASAIGILVGVSISGLAVLPWLAGVLNQYVSIWSLPPYLFALSLIMLAFWVYLARPVAASEAGKPEVAREVMQGAE